MNHGIKTRNNSLLYLLRVLSVTDLLRARDQGQKYIGGESVTL
jgi:hypothetical protein